MKKKILSLVLTVCMVLSLLPAVSLPASANEPQWYRVGETNIGTYNPASGNSDIYSSASGDGWEWTYSDGVGTLTLTDAYIKGTVNTDGNSYGAYLPGNTTIVLHGDSTIAGGAVSSGNSYGVYCAGNLIIENARGLNDSNGSLTAVGGNSTSGDSAGISAGSLSISSGKVTAIGSTGSDSSASFGIFAESVVISGSANVTAIGGTAGSSCGVGTSAGLTVSGGSLTAVGGYASTYGSGGIVTSTTMTVSGGIVTAQGGKSASGSSYGVYVDDSTVTLTGGLLVASSGRYKTESGYVSRALNCTPTGGTLLAGEQIGTLAVYGDSATYTSNNIRTSTLYLQNIYKSTSWSNSAGSGWKWDYDEAGSTLTLKNMIIVGADNVSGDSFGIYGQGNISIVYEGVNVVCGGTSSDDSCGISVEPNDTADGISLSGDGTLIALGRQAGGSSKGIELLNPEGGETGSLNISGGTVIALGGDADGDDAVSYGLFSCKGVQIENSNIIVVGGAADGSFGVLGGAGVSVSGGHTVAVGGYSTDTGGAGVFSLGITTFSGSANVVAAGDGYGVAAYSVTYNKENPVITPADFQLGTNALDTVTLTAMGGDGAANANGATAVSGKVVACDGGTYETVGTAVRFRLADAVIAVAHNGSDFTNYASFAEGWNEAVGDSNTENTAVKLLADWTAEHDNDHSSSFGSGIGFGSAGCILVPDGKKICLDLNGCTIDRGLTDYSNTGIVIDVTGSLVLKDSFNETEEGKGDGTTGKITGGYDNYESGILVENLTSGHSASLVMDGGTITNNVTQHSGWGAVAVETNASFTMNGGIIRESKSHHNDADGKGVGVYVTNDASFTMNGGSITANNGGVCYEGIFIMNGGSICNNYLNEGDSGVYGWGNCTFSVSGNPIISGNKVEGSETENNVYLQEDQTITISSALQDGAYIGVTTQTAPVAGTPVNITGSNSDDYSSYFHSDKSFRIQNSGSGSDQVVQLAVMPSTGIFGAKFYQPQVWDCQRSPAFPVANHSFYISGLKAPYDENLRKVSFADPASDYVTFEYVKDVSALDAATQTRIVNSLKCYTGASEASIKSAAVVKETLHSGANQATETTLSSIGLVWALGNDGFLYTAMDGALKYSGGVGTYVTFAAHKAGDSIIYTPDKTEPYTNEEITADENKLAPEDGTPTAPTDTTYQELIWVVDNSTTPAPVSGATVKITVNGSEHSDTTDANGRVQFTGLPKGYGYDATVTKGGDTSSYDKVDSPEAVLTFTGNSTDARQKKVYVDFEYGTDGSDLKGGIVSYLGAGAVSDERIYHLTKGDTAMFTIKPASGYKVSSVKWNGTEQPDAVTNRYFSSAVTEAESKLIVTFTANPKTSIFSIKYTTAEVFDVQRSPAFPDDSTASSIRFSWLDEPYDTNLDHITLGTGEYIKFDKVSSVETAGKTAEYTKSLQYWTDAQQISTAALVEENVYNASGTKVKTLGTGLIWCYNDPAKGFLFTTMDGVLGDCGGVGSYVSFNALRYGSSVTQLTDSAEPLQWDSSWSAGTVDDNTDPKGQPENPDGDTVDDTQDVTFDFLGKVLDATTKVPVDKNTYVTLTWAGTDYKTTTDANGRFVVSGLPYGENGSYTVKIDDETFTGELPDLGGVENSKTRTASLTAPEIVFLLNSTSGAITAGATHRITVSKTGSGSVSPLGTDTVNDGGSLRVFFTASNGYSLSEVKIDGTANAGAKTNGYYKFTGVTANHTVAVTFTASGTNPGGNSGSGGSGSSGSSGSTTTPTTGKAEPVIVDGTEYDIGTKATTDTTTTVTVDEAKLQTQLESASDSVVVPITSKTDTTVARLVVKNVEDMAKKDMTLSVDIGDVQYNMRSTTVDTAALMKALGATDSTKVPISVTITNLEQSAVTVKNGELMLNPVEFTVTATYGGKTVEVERFSQYVQRVIEIPAGTDASKITTALRVEDGEHVPTYVFQKDGKWYARINSLTNSTYTLIYNKQSFADAAGKWYEKTADEMASRCVIFGRTNGDFDGGASITRAEFAAIIVRALGLPESGTSSFSDVASSAWCYGAVSAASEYGIVCGYTDGSFRPNANITRQEAMAMVARAAKVAELNGVTTDDLSKFSDADTVGAWAQEYVTYNVANGLIVGNNGYLKPNADISRAETATVVLRLLQKAELVDVRTQA